MDIQTLTKFFMWCTILAGGVYIWWAIFLIFFPDFMYRMNSKWFTISRDAFNVTIYALLGLFKLIYIVFIIVPFVALLIIR